MKTVPFDSVPQADWDSVAECSTDAWLMHYAGWVGIEASFFVRRNLSFAVMERDRILAIQPLYLSDSLNGTPHGETLVHSGIHRHAGLALCPGLSWSETEQAQAVAMRQVMEQAFSFGAHRIQLNAHNLAPRNRSTGRDHIPYWVSEYGFQLGLGFGPGGMDPAPGFSTCNADQIVDLGLTESDLMSGLDEPCRRAIRKAEKSGLAFTVDVAPDRLDRYFALAERSAVRTGETLPPRDYYKAILDGFSKTGNVIVCFATSGEADVAGLLLLVAKGAASFLAGVSDPDMLAMRPNDFIHWHAILTAKDKGLEAYRFGPTFPEVPTGWPIAKVSAFKGKFGARSIPMIQGSLFLDRQRAEASVANATKHMAALARLQTAAKPPALSLAADNIAHHLRLLGIHALSTGSPPADVLVADAAVEGGWIAARQAVDRGVPVVLLRPSRAAEYLNDVAFANPAGEGQRLCTAVAAQPLAPAHRLRSLHGIETVTASHGISVVMTDAGKPAWIWLPLGKAGVLLIGTELHRDLTLFRQGNPAAAANRPDEAQWGIAGERPSYLFEGQLEADKPQDRMADWWMWTLRDALIRHAGVKADDVLPFGAKGVVIVTGDDDQAPLADYRAQEKLLGAMPVTYFLHPLTKHTAETIAEHSKGRKVEWEIHPDALETPHEYGSRFAEQAEWFEGLTGHKPRFVRNHGFLNDGYWGHMSAWEAHGIAGSSNLPGVDGKVLNASLLPARLALEGHLTDHWSLLTAFGDGVMFALEWDENQVATAIAKAGQRIIDSDVPGILVFNLHPANHKKAACMHVAARKLVSDLGFAAMTLGDAIAWFAARDRGEAPVLSEGMIAPFGLQHGRADTVSRNSSPLAGPFAQKRNRLWNAARQMLGGARAR